jgi:predicted phage tail protein
MAKLNSNSFGTVLDLISEGEIEGLKDGDKSILLNNVELLNSQAVVKTGTYSQTGGSITVTLAGHGYAVGDLLAFNVTTGSAGSGTYKVATITASTFTTAAKDQSSTSGSLTIAKSSDYNFKDVTTYKRNGTNNQDYIPGNNEIESEVGVGVKVLKDTPVVRTITEATTSAVRLTLSFPRLQTYNKDGSIGGSSVEINVEVQYSGGSYTTPVGFPVTVKGRADDNYQQDYIINLNGAFPVNIRVTRITEDSTSPKKLNEFNWSSYTKITYAKLRYPNSALVQLRFSAEQFSSIPQRAYWIRGIKVAIPSNATVDTTTGALIYSGAWDGTFAATNQWTSDPAWCLWALLTNTRFGFGNYLNTALLDKWSFYQSSSYASALNTYTSTAEIAERTARGLAPRTGSTNDYNATTGKHGVPDGFGKYEPRFSCNVNIQTQEEAYMLINNLSSVMRAMPFWSTGSLTVTQDKPVASSYLFTTSNVGESGFSYSGSNQKSRATVVIVSYFDMAMRTVAFEYVEDQAAIAKYGVNTKKVEAFACTSRGQAHRLGQWMLYAEGRETEVVAFTASIDSGVIVRPGMVVDVADPVRAGSRRGGRISAATTTVVTVDDATGLTTANSPTLSVILPNGTVETKAVSAISGNAITVSSAFSAAPNNNSVWVFQSTDLQTSQWRVISVGESEGINYGITALSYNSSKYDAVEYNLALTERDVTNLNELPATPTNITFTETLYTYQAEVRSKLLIGWLPVVGVNQYRIKWRKDYGNWSVNTLQGADYEILNTTPGLYEVEIYSLNAINEQSLSALTGSVDALGKTAPPSDVPAFTAFLDPNAGVTLSWDPVTDLDLQGYEIWQGSAFGVGTLLGVFKATSKKLGVPSASTTTFWIKSLDTSGSYSVNALSASLTITGAPAPTTSGSFAGENFTLAWGAVTGSLATAFYEVRDGTTSSTWATATSLGTVQGTTFTIKAAWSGTRRFFVAAMDIIGTVGTSNYYDAIVIVPAQPTITTQVIDNNVLLYWNGNDCTQTLPIVSYELRKGATWATAQVIGSKQGSFTVVFETISGDFRYWLAGIDVAGNYGTPGNVTTSVSQPPDYVLKLDQNSTFGGTKTNTLLTDGALLACVNTTETWQSHFTSRSWTTLQDQINAGFPYFAMPSQTTGQYVEDIDYGAVLASSKISTLLTTNTIAGATTITPTLAYKKLSGDPWTTYAGVSSVFGTNFRYIRVQYDFTSAGGDDLLQVANLNVKLDSKLKNDSGTGTANSADSGGTVVSFGVAFVDIDSISVTPAGTTPVIGIYDFVDAPNPTQFRVLLYSTSGSRVSGAFSWSARGV